MASNQRELLEHWERITRASERNNPNNPIPESRPGPSYEPTTDPVQYFPNISSELPPNVLGNCVRNQVWNYFVPSYNFENNSATGTVNSVEGDCTAGTVNSVEGDCTAGTVNIVDEDCTAGTVNIVEGDCTAIAARIGNSSEDCTAGIVDSDEEHCTHSGKERFLFIVQNIQEDGTSRYFLPVPAAPDNKCECGRVGKNLKVLVPVENIDLTSEADMEVKKIINQVIKLSRRNKVASRQDSSVKKKGYRCQRHVRFEDCTTVEKNGKKDKNVEKNGKKDKNVEKNAKKHKNVKKDKNVKSNIGGKEKRPFFVNELYPPKRTELSEEDLQLVRDHFNGKITLGVDFIRRIHGIPEPIPRAVPVSDPKLILPKDHPWADWVCAPYPVQKEDEMHKHTIPQANFQLPAFSQDPIKSVDEGIKVKIQLNKLKRIPQQGK